MLYAKLTRDEWKALLTRQQTCAICGAALTEQTGQADHDHATGALRAFLCQGCNFRIGFVERAHRAPSDAERAYLERHGSVIPDELVTTVRYLDIHTRLPRKLARAAQAHAWEAHKSLNDIIQEALAAYMERQ